MSLTITEILILMLSHYIADFWTQSRWEADNKSKSNFALMSHVMTYTLTLFVIFSLICIVLLYRISTNQIEEIGFDLNILWFFPITLLLHFITDYITSRITSYLYRTNKIKSFFSVIGFDQILHYVQIFLTYHFLTY
jgi:hypothetical protein